MCVPFGTSHLNAVPSPLLCDLCIAMFGDNLLYFKWVLLPPIITWWWEYIFNYSILRKICRYKMMKFSLKIPRWCCLHWRLFSLRKRQDRLLKLPKPTPSYRKTYVTCCMPSWDSNLLPNVSGDFIFWVSVRGCGGLLCKRGLPLARRCVKLVKEQLNWKLILPKRTYE